MAHRSFTPQNLFWFLFLFWLLGYGIPQGLRWFNRSSPQRIATYCSYKLKEGKDTAYSRLAQRLTTVANHHSPIEIESYLNNRFVHFSGRDSLAIRRLHTALVGQLDTFMFDHDVRVVRLAWPEPEVWFLFDIYREDRREIWLRYHPSRPTLEPPPSEILQLALRPYWTVQLKASMPGDG